MTHCCRGVFVAEYALEAVSKLSTRAIFVDAIVMNPLDWQDVLACEHWGKTKVLDKPKLWNLPVILTHEAQRGKPMAATWGRL